MKIARTIKRHRWAIVTILCLLAGAGWYYHTHEGEFSREAVLAYGKSLSPAWFIVSFFALPLAGVPISVLLVLAGIRFGLWGGMALAAAGIAFHNFVAFHIVHRLLRDKFRRKLRRAGYRIPEIADGHKAWFTFLFAAIHGPPYAMKLYLLALANIPFRIYFWVGAPVYILFCLIPVGAGSAVMEVNTTLIYGIVFAITILTLGGKWLEKRFKFKP